MDETTKQLYYTYISKRAAEIGFSLLSVKETVDLILEILPELSDLTAIKNYVENSNQIEKQKTILLLKTQIQSIDPLIQVIIP